MKRVLLMVVLCVVLMSWISSAVALDNAINPLAGGRVQIQSSISNQNGSVKGVVSAIVKAEYTLGLTVYIQAKNASGVWLTKSTASGQGSNTVSVYYPVSSGTSYRVKYSYKLYDASNVLIESGNGYSNVLQVP